MKTGPTARLKALSFSMVRTTDGTILKRGWTELWFTKDEHADRLTKLLELFEQPSTVEEVLGHFHEELRPEIRKFFKLLVAKNILVPCDDVTSRKEAESPLDIFYWQFDAQQGAIEGRVRSRHILVLGADGLSRAIVRALEESGFNHITAIEDTSCLRSNSEAYCPSGSINGKHPTISEPRMQDVDLRAIDCLVATSDYGERDRMREWNELAIRHDCHFLPVVLQNGVGYVGPLVIPGETACYECLVSRENSHLEDWMIRRKIERTASDTGCVVGYHPLMLATLASVAAFELVKAYGEIVAFRRFGHLIEVNLLHPGIEVRRVLKIPRCVTCSNLLLQPSTSIHKPIPLTDS